MIQIELMLGENFAAILASVLVSKKHVLPGEFHLFSWQPIVNPQDDNLGNLQRNPHCSDHLTREGVRGVIEPGFNIVGLVATLPLGLHHLGSTQAKKFEGAPHGAGMDRLPEPVQHKDGAFGHHFHNFTKQWAPYSLPRQRQS